MLGVALGADLSIRYFTGTGARIHDRFQAPMIEELLRVLDERWTARLEVPIPRPGRGVVDVLLEDRSSPTTVVGEAQSEFRRIEEQLRWVAEKAQAIESPDRSVSRLLVLRSTVATREISRRYRSILSAAYPARTSDVVDALTVVPFEGSIASRIVRTTIGTPNSTETQVSTGVARTARTANASTTRAKRDSATARPATRP